MLPSPDKRTAWDIVNQPMFRITSLRKEAGQVYACIGIGILIGLFIGFLIWHPRPW